MIEIQFFQQNIFPTEDSLKDLLLQCMKLLEDLVGGEHA
jgi:hypothetical protein